MVEPDSVAFIVEGLGAVRRCFNGESDTPWCCAGVALRAGEALEA